jgi:hypothetical protein
MLPATQDETRVTLDALRLPPSWSGGRRDVHPRAGLARPARRHRHRRGALAPADPRHRKGAQSRASRAASSRAGHEDAKRPARCHVRAEPYCIRRTRAFRMLSWRSVTQIRRVVRQVFHASHDVFSGRGDYSVPAHPQGLIFGRSHRQVARRRTRPLIDGLTTASWTRCSTSSSDAGAAPAMSNQPALPPRFAVTGTSVRLCIGWGACWRRA